MMTPAEHFAAADRKLAAADGDSWPDLAVYLSAIGHALLAHIDGDTFDHANIHTRADDTPPPSPAGGRARRITDPDSLEGPGS